MSKIFLATLILVVLMFSAYSAEVEKDEGVLVLKQDNFDEVIKENEKILVEFYAPWCGHCKKLAPEYAKAAQKLSEGDLVVPLAKVDATEEKDLAGKYGVKGFPTLKWFVNGEAQDYTGGRTEDEIINWIKKKSGPPSTEVDNDKLAKLIENEKFLVVYYGSTDTDEFKEYEKVASVDDKRQFVHNTNSDATLPEGLTAPGVAVHRKFDEPTVVHKGKINKDELTDFIATSSVPTLIEFSDEYIEPIFQNQKPALFLFVDSSNEEHKKLVETFGKAAESEKGRIFFAHSGVKDGIQQRLAEFVGVTEADLPRLMIIGFNDQGVDKYVYDGEIAAITSENVADFITKFEKGDLKKFLKSEEVPESNDEPVKVVVGKNFDDIVGGDDEVLLEFYAPWCGHCKALEPKYKELAEELKDVKGLVIAKCDATANEIDGINISGFPTIKFFAKGTQHPKDYEGEREVDAFKTYLEENSDAYRDWKDGKSDL